ncbi:MAG: YbaN family protein [Pirellulaceae bacterium]
MSVSTSEFSAVEVGQTPKRLTLRQFALAALGVVFVVLAGFGAVLPGIPTVGPLLVASFCFTKSCPALEQRLIRNRFFGPYLRFLDGTTEMPLKAKLISIALMWTSIGFSCFLLSGFPALCNWCVPLLIACGVFATWFIYQFGKKSANAVAPTGVRSE